VSAHWPKAAFVPSPRTRLIRSTSAHPFPPHLRETYPPGCRSTCLLYGKGVSIHIQGERLQLPALSIILGAMVFGCDLSTTGFGVPHKNFGARRTRVHQAPVCLNRHALHGKILFVNSSGMSDGRSLSRSDFLESMVCSMPAA
jgi:hypothetical protein